MWRTRSVEAAVEAKKADGATCTALLMPRPPNLTGSVVGRSGLGVT